jgi:hypothetical protein
MFISHVKLHAHEQVRCNDHVQAMSTSQQEISNYVLDKNDLNIVRLHKSEDLAVLHIRFQRGTIRLK